MVQEEIIERLKRHYDENVLGFEHNPEYGELEKSYGQPNVIEADLEGAEIVDFDYNAFGKKWGFEPPEFVKVRVPDDKSHPLMEKRGVGWSWALTCHERSFEKDSPLYGTYVMLVTENDDEGAVDGHEAFHILHMKRSWPMNDVFYDAEKENRQGALKSVQAELYLLGEMLANRHIIDYFDSESCPPGKRLYGVIGAEDVRGARRLKDKHCPYYSEHSVDDMAEGCLPNSGVVSFQAAKATVEKEMSRYLKEKVDDGMRALETLEKNLPKAEVTRILLSCGPTREEFESGRYIRPIDELVLWSNHYKEVLGKNGA